MSIQALTLSQCKEYIKNIKDLEIRCYQLDMLFKQLSHKQTQIKLSIQKTTNFAPRLEHETILSSIMNGVVFLIPGAIAGFVLGFIIWAFGGEGFLHNFQYGRDVSLRPYLMGGTIIVAVLAFLFGASDLLGRKQRNIAALQVYHQQEYDKKTSLQYYQNILSKTDNAIRECQIKQRDTKTLLQNYYKLDYIYPSYRGLIPICTIYQYLDSGRCDTLTGHEGAYNLYENELRMNTIIGKLDDVIDRLDDISTSQRLLAQEIKQSNAQISRISGTLDNIENNTALTQYYSSITASNTTFMSWLAAFSYDEQKRNR